MIRHTATFSLIHEPEVPDFQKLDFEPYGPEGR